MDAPLTLNCKSIKKETSRKQFDRSLLKWNNKYCSRCSRVTLGINRGFHWYCNNCNTYLLDFLDGRKSISHIVNDTTSYGGTFVFCKICSSLWLHYGLTIKCCEVDIL